MSAVRSRRRLLYDLFWAYFSPGFIGLLELIGDSDSAGNCLCGSEAAGSVGRSSQDWVQWAETKNEIAEKCLIAFHSYFYIGILLKLKPRWFKE